MRQFTAATHLIVSLAATAAAVITAFALPTVAQAADSTTSINIGWGGKGMEGSGRMVTVPRTIGAFSIVRVEGPLDVTAHPGSAPAVSVTAEDNIEPLIETVVDGQTLVLRLSRSASFRTHKKIAVDVAFTQLTGAQIRGSGDLNVDRPAGPRLDTSIDGSGDLRVSGATLTALGAQISGSGDITLSGTADDASYSISGSGDIHAADLQGRRVTVEISGSGDARVHATESIDARIAGSGDIVYSGHPAKVARKIAGSGSISATH